jgi:hypothetical protein
MSVTGAAIDSTATEFTRELEHPFPQMQTYEERPPKGSRVPSS